MHSASAPSAEQIQAARLKAGLTQSQCAALVHVDLRSWRRWELAERQINLAAWELFLLRTGQIRLEKIPAIKN